MCRKARLALCAMAVLTLALAAQPDAGSSQGAAVTSAAAPAPVRYRVGVNTGWAPNVAEPARIDWTFETGATVPRIGMAMDQFRTNPGHPDACVKRFVDAGRSGLAFLFPGGGEVKLPDGSVKHVEARPPDGLWEPVFANGTDQGDAGAPLNPRNEWAWFVGGLVERYDGDGHADAPGSPRLEWFSLYNEPDYLDWPQRPTDPKDRTLRNWLGRDAADLARLVFVSRQAARAANPAARVGPQICFPETLGFLLDDARHPAAGIDFIDFHAYASPGSDTLIERKDGLLPMLRAMRAEFARRGLGAPLFVCSEIGYPGDEAAEPAQRAAAAKVQMAAATQPDLLCAQWYALFDPSWTSMGLIADVTRLPVDGAGRRPKDALYAMRTAAWVLEPMASGSMRYAGAVPVGDAARAHRFDRGGLPCVAAWAADFDGKPVKPVPVRLPLPAGRYAVLHWDWCLTGKPGSLLETSGGEPVTLTVGADPVYVVGYEGTPPATDVISRPARPAPPPWRTACSANDPQYPPANGFDGSFDTQWVGGYGSREAWWQVTLDEAVEASAIRVKLGQLPAGVTCVVQVSDDGEAWRSVSAPFASANWSVQAVSLAGAVTSRRWRLLYTLPSSEVNAGLFEVEIGPLKGR